jgi:D-alanyl-lipoteichoic acid acyltransferase DltB (MBOAT superfamily)
MVHAIHQRQLLRLSDNRLLCLLAAGFRQRVPSALSFGGQLLLLCSLESKFLALIFLISTIDFLTARRAGANCSRLVRKLLLAVSILGDLGTLFIFKYFNFFSDSLTELSSKLGWHFSPHIFSNLILPLGLSFMTFRSLSYVIDVYRSTLRPTRHYLDYLAFVAFFPTVVAGPIARAGDLLPQFRERPELASEQGTEGIFLIVTGLIKKIAIADFLGNNLVDRIFDQPQLYSSLETLAAIYGYALQIYFDFSGYSDIAIGSALLLGFKLPINFNAPYRACDLRDFWRRWHITLSTWLFDYVFVAIGGLRKRRINLYRNLFLTFLIGGLWHGAAWTFVVWGALHGLGLSFNHWWARRQFVPFRGGRRPPVQDAVSEPSEIPPAGAGGQRPPLNERGLNGQSKTGRGEAKDQRRWWAKAIGAFLTFHFICLTWVVFRAESLTQALEVVKRLGARQYSHANLATPILLTLLLGFLSHWMPADAFQKARRAWAWLPAPVQAAFILAVAVGLYYVSGAEAQFIYGNF